MLYFLLQLFYIICAATLPKDAEAAALWQSQCFSAEEQMWTDVMCVCAHTLQRLFLQHQITSVWRHLFWQWKISLKQQQPAHTRNADGRGEKALSTSPSTTTTSLPPLHCDVSLARRRYILLRMRPTCLERKEEKKLTLFFSLSLSLTLFLFYSTFLFFMFVHIYALCCFLLNSYCCVLQQQKSAEKKTCKPSKTLSLLVSSLRYSFSLKNGMDKKNYTTGNFVPASSFSFQAKNFSCLLLKKRISMWIKCSRVTNSLYWLQTESTYIYI